MLVAVAGAALGVDAAGGVLGAAAVATDSVDATVVLGLAPGFGDGACTGV